MKRQNIFFYTLILVVAVIIVSCQSMEGVIIPKQIIPCPKVKTEGEISKGDKKNDSDIFISVKNVSRYKFDFFGLKGYFREKINLDYKDSVYPIKITYTKVIEKNRSDYIFSNIKIKKLPKEYKINTLEPIGFGYVENEAKFSMSFSKEMLPLYITSFWINNRVFHVFLSESYDNAEHSLLRFIMYEKQKYRIVDEMGYEYASFTKTDFRICDQPDSADYDFIPLIAAYSYIFSIVR